MENNLKELRDFISFYKDITNLNICIGSKWKKNKSSHLKPFKVENAKLLKACYGLLWITAAPPPGLSTKRQLRIFVTEVKWTDVQRCKK